MKKKSPPPLVNHRWNAPSLEQILDDYLPQWAEGKHPDFSGPDGYRRLRSGVRRFAESLLSHMEMTLEKAAAKGIAEALNLMRNPDYYQTVKRRRVRQTESEKRARQEWEEEQERRRRGEFTEEERKYEIGRITRELQYHETQIVQLKERKMRVETSKPLIVESQSKSKDDGDDDFWADTISFE